MRWIACRVARNHFANTMVVDERIPRRSPTMPSDLESHSRRYAMSRRQLLGAAGLGGIALSLSRASAETINLPLPGGPDEREITTAFPQKGAMILQRTRPPLLETPWSVFDKGVFTPNDQFYVRWHWAVIPTSVDVNTFKLNVHGHVNQTVSLTLQDIVGMPQFELAAVNQCSGNSRGFFQPCVPGGEWADGAMGNARWLGVRLRDVLDRAGVKPGAVQVRFNGLDEPVVPDAPDFKKSLAIDHARDGEVMLAYAMNGEQPDDNYWTKTAYTIPDTPRANVTPEQTGVKMIPINRMVPRSFITNVNTGATLPAAKPSLIRGIAFGGDSGVASVDVSTDAGKTWMPAQLGKDEGKYSFRQWQSQITLPSAGKYSLAVRCKNTGGEAQPDTPNWNGSGFMRNVIETTNVVAS
jgi:DMSO/TMAO reductase YedYZ molybdopterin-dependent catalytic subunit